MQPKLMVYYYAEVTLCA